MDEYVDRKALMDRMNDYCVRNCPDTTYCISCFMTDAKEIVDSQDAEDVRPVAHGEWQVADFHTVTCSACCFEVDIIKTDSHVLSHMNFCPNCGADMRKTNDG